MDPVFLARLQFAITVGFHFLFPPISIGLAWILVLVEGRAWRTGDPVWTSLGVFFGRLLALTFAVGVATGIVMEFQFGTNWAAYSKFVGDIFGAPLAAEGVFSFFLESGFLGLYLFGRGRVSKGVHWFSALMVAVGATLSAFWILAANSWQQTPAGFEVVDGRAVLTSFAEAIFNSSMWVRFMHTMAAALLAGAFFVAGVCALLIIRGNRSEAAIRGLKLAVVLGFVWALFTAFPTGHHHARQVAHDQPEKFAAIEGLYSTTRGAPLIFFALQESPPPRLSAVIQAPKITSWLAFGDPDAEIKGINEFPPENVPPLWVTFVSFHNMVLLGLLFQGVTFLGLLLWWWRKLDTARWFHWIVLLVSPLPLAACQFGWVAAEVGRQPWTVYKVLRTADSVSVTVGAGELWFSILLLGTIYIALGVLYVFLLWREVARGPGKVEVA
jgi:cytochrome d ubiquinol oxidase subunit I